MNARIKEVRKALGLTQKEFAERIQIGNSSLSKIEKGINNPSKQTIALICKEFAVNQRWLEDGTGEMVSIPYTVPETYEEFTAQSKSNVYSEKDAKEQILDAVNVVFEKIEKIENANERKRLQKLTMDNIVSLMENVKSKGYDPNFLQKSFEIAYLLGSEVGRCIERNSNGETQSS